MQKAIWLFLCFVLPSELLFNNSNVFSAESSSIKIVYISKITDINPRNERVGGLAELSTLVKELRQNNKNVLFLHGGDALAPSAMSSFDHGNHMIDILNSLRPNLMSINEREFTFGEDELIIRVSEAAFPFISSNIYDPYVEGNIDGVEEYQCFDIDNNKICFLSVIDPDVSINYLPDRIEILDYFNQTKKMSDNLKVSGADSIILLSGYKLDLLEKLLKDNIVDAVFTSDGDRDEIQLFDEGLHVLQGTNKGKVAVIELNLEKSGGQPKKSFKAELINLSDYPPDPDIVERINYYTGKLSQIMDTVVGKTSVPLDTSRVAVRTEENRFANFTTDALREHYNADIALINGGSFRGDRIYPVDTKITRKDIQAELPFLNRGQLIKIKGAHIQEAMEHSLSLFEEIKGRFLHVSGMEVRYCIENPVGERIQAIRIQDKPINPDKEYLVATSDYLFRGGDGFTMLKKGEPMDTEKSNLIIWVIIRNYLEQTGIIDSVIEGRLRAVCNE